MRVKRTAHVYRVLTLVVALGASAGCGTIANQSDYWSKAPENPLTPGGHVWWIYGGTVTNMCALSPYYHCPFGLGKLGDGTSLYDLPLSFAADTVLLPLTIAQQIRGRPGEQDTDKFKEAESEPWPKIKRTIPFEEEPGWVPFQFSVAHSENWHLFKRSYDVRGVRLNFSGGTVRGVAGVDIGFEGSIDYHLTGLQANVFSKVRGRCTGLQLGLLNVADEVRGVQAGVCCVGGGLTPPSRVKGIQVALINDARNLSGLQIGLINYHRNGWLLACPLINIGFGGSEEDSEEGH